MADTSAFQLSDPQRVDPILVLVLALSQLSCGQSIARHLCRTIVQDPSLAPQLDSQLLQLMQAFPPPELHLTSER
jgi:hypothetical protein